MAESMEMKKRKRPSLPATRSLVGIFTRSKSQLYLHRNRSGQTRPESNIPYPLPSLKKPRSSSLPEDPPSVSVKDLRSRRVFSPTSIDGVIRNCLDDIQKLEKSELLENGDVQKSETSMEELAQSTPPDAEIFGGKHEVTESNGKKKPIESPQKHELSSSVTYSSKSVLKPCSRAKLFKRPGSFSYRRLLPYLMDMEKDSSSYCPEMVACQNTNKGSEDKGFLDSKRRETLVEKATGGFLEGQNTDYGEEFNKVRVEPLASRGSECLSMLAGAICSDKLMTDEAEVVECPCEAQSLKVLDQKLSTVNNKGESCEVEAGSKSKDDAKQPEIEGTPNATLNSVISVLPAMRGDRECTEGHRIGNDDEVLEQVEDLNGEYNLKAQPVSGMSSKPETDDSRGNREDCVSKGVVHVIGKTTIRNLNRNNGHDGDKSLDSSPKNKLVPNQRLHLKLSKIPGSFSYRRLLPYLTEITKDFSCISGNDQSLKVEKSSDERPLSPLSTSEKDIHMETFNAKSCPVEHHAGDDSMLPVAVATATRCSSSHKMTQSPPKQVADSPVIMDSQQEQGLLVKHAALDKNEKLETTPENVVEPPAMSSSSPIISGLMPRGEGVTLVSHQLSPETEEECRKSTVRCMNHEKQNEADKFAETSIPLGIPAASLKRGILKRNPLGCRGICACLNCSSFRLHAERSFEFSRNQMQDAEEVALGLIKELAYLRNLLEDSASDAKDHRIICINKVKEACKKASEAEELARSRLSEMYHDLNIHCRIPCGQRPTVRFANYVEEHIIPMPDSSSK